MASAYTGERRTHLEALAALLPGQGLASRMIGGEEAVLWVWHPGTARRTLVFATPSRDGWLFLWSPGGQSSVDDLRGTARALEEALRNSAG
ncbi:hypothetical protein [Nonomuraea rhizosphaerae]|uniref:hypothetical protein n=1 Tax=Nonomuraea rhizosphaerae TaxID=2665663 RepID=UPI001C6057A0|nr:hypothetical protein [Nonomuraea rhizosphaerae]